jgi:hypothetical protein
MKKVTLFNTLISGFRHRYLVYFRPHYTIRSLLNRKGECKKCGFCCFLNRPWCRYFKDNKCQVYNKQPFFCKIFPIDEKDKEMSGVSGVCGYKWEKNEER